MPNRLQSAYSPLASHSRSNLLGGKAYRHPGGEVSTVMSGSVNHPALNRGAPTLIPFVWDGRILDEEQAIERAIRSGVVWPSFKDHNEATEYAKRLSGRLPTTPEGWEGWVE